MLSLDRLLDSYRADTLGERDKGTAFEKLIVAWLTEDPVQSRRFKNAELWSDWAKDRGRDRTDIGIDLVATRHDGGLVAVQCKFLDSNRSVSKKDIDSFISASAQPIFSERMIVETTDKPWSENARKTIERQTIPTTRIGLRVLRDSSVDWSTFASTGQLARPAPKALRPHQVKALEAVRKGFSEADRGKLIMACGTGKTLAALRIAEERAGPGGHVLCLVPSLALMAQTVREWCADAELPITAFAVCSDAQVGRRRRGSGDVAEIEATDLALPATTDATILAQAVAVSDAGSMRVVFATYHSLSVISAAQRLHGLPRFDLIVCDEAHRTTGATFENEDPSAFVMVHDNDAVCGAKRLYMTATPRIYGENAKSMAREKDVELHSMDNTQKFGEVLFHLSFAQAVESGLLSDYRVIVLAMDEGQVSTATQKRLSDEKSELNLDDATKIVGCWKALSKKGLSKASLSGAGDSGPMRRVLAFCNRIDKSKLVRDEFESVVSAFQSSKFHSETAKDLSCEVEHVDGTHSARERGRKLDWLKEDAGKNVCRILSNARCLIEGVDVPALDAILFLHPRNSKIDVVQAVGRVMRKAPDKQMGYVILPVGIPPGISPSKALGNNRKYRVVWQILNALRAHDERLDAVINQARLGQDVSDRIAIVDGSGMGSNAEIRAVTATIEQLPCRSVPRGSGIGEGGGSGGNGGGSEGEGWKQRSLLIDEFSSAVMAKIVEKCGKREYWEDWAKDVADIAKRHIVRISGLVEQPGSDAKEFFDDFLKELRDDLNESVTEKDAIEMLAQHLITRPVFDALFEGHPFAKQNPVSVAMTEVLSVIDEAQVEREGEGLEKFYTSVRRRAEGITDTMARQNLIVELYDKFFRGAFPRTTKMLGIVYTPVEIVDFIIRSANDALEEEFGQTLGSEGVHIIDPFTGTGTFITRLLQSGLISPEDMERKYRKEIHANEIVLLAYYIAAINIESVFHSVSGRKGYLPFGGICLTDTFALHEGEDQLSFYMKENTDRRERQKGTDIQVIIGNPPYSAGQKSENDNAKNVAYERLDQRIRSTYAERSKAALLKNLYDSYIRAIRWGSDRLGEAGVMAFVSGSAWIERIFADGLRKCLAEEFTSVHVFHLRGDIRKNMLSGGRAGEGENVFGQGNMTGVAITVFVKNPDAPEQGRIRFHDVGDSLNRKEKLEIVSRFGSIRGINEADGWASIVPDEHGDWLDQRNPGFEAYPNIGDKRDRTGKVLFNNYSIGVVTGRDAWCINPSRTEVWKNIKSMISFYNKEIERWETVRLDAESSHDSLPNLNNFINADTAKISWDGVLKQHFQKCKRFSLNDGQFVPCVCRPFSKQWQFYSRQLNNRVYQMPSIFPNADLPNRVIAVTGKGGRSGFSALMMDALPSIEVVEKSQCFPLYLWQEDKPSDPSSPRLFSDGDNGYRRVDAITDYAVQTFRKAYPSEGISRKDIFHYIYGLLHSEDYRARFRANLAKELPRIPCVKSVEDYRAFRDAGKRLGELHVGYERVDPYSAVIDMADQAPAGNPEALYRVTKMKHSKVPGKDGKKVNDLSTVIYNPHITIRDIPDAAWDYVVNGKPALSWVMGRQCVKTDKVSGIVSDANAWAVETAGNPHYPLDLFLRVITVSLETMKIVRGLPKLVI